MRICTSAVTFKNLITDNLQKKDESEEFLKQFKVIASLQVKILRTQSVYLTLVCSALRDCDTLVLSQQLY